MGYGFGLFFYFGLLHGLHKIRLYFARFEKFPFQVVYLRKLKWIRKGASDEISGQVEFVKKLGG
jgi:hypothetical protein